MYSTAQKKPNVFDSHVNTTNINALLFSFYTKNNTNGPAT